MTQYCEGGGSDAAFSLRAAGMETDLFESWQSLASLAIFQEGINHFAVVTGQTKGISQISLSCNAKSLSEGDLFCIKLHCHFLLLLWAFTHFEDGRMANHCAMLCSAARWIINHQDLMEVVSVRGPVSTRGQGCLRGARMQKECSTFPCTLALWICIFSAPFRCTALCAVPPGEDLSSC